MADSEGSCVRAVDVISGAVYPIVGGTDNAQVKSNKIHLITLLQSCK